MKSAEEWEAQQLFQEAEEARQLAQAMRLSAVSCEWQRSGQMQAFYQFCEEVGLSPDDVGATDAAAAGERPCAGFQVREEVPQERHHDGLQRA